MGRKLYVGNLNFDTSEDMLRMFFESNGGHVEDCVVLKDRETGRSRGFGFVTMSTDQEAQEAISSFDGANLDGRDLRVNEAQERSGGGGGGGGGGGRGGFGGGGGRGGGGGYGGGGGGRRPGGGGGGGGGGGRGGGRGGDRW